MRFGTLRRSLLANVLIWGVACSSGGPATTGGSGGSSSSTGGNPGSGGVGSGGISSAGGDSGSGGSTSAGDVTGSGGSTGAGGVIGSGGSTSTGGRGGSNASGGATGVGGKATGGAAGGGTGSGAGGSTGTGGGAAYQGPCDVVPGGCAEAYSVTRAMVASYTGPLLQLGRTSDKTTQNVGQTSAHAADLSTWSAFCGGSQANCVVAKVYAQVHSGSNDLTPGVWKTPWNPDCSAGGYTCAAKFTIEAATGLPILTTVSPQEYALSGDNFATGINGGTKAMGIMYNGKPVANSVYCCGVIGLTHKYNATDTHGTDFMLALAYGWRDSGGCCIAVNCGSSTSYCVGAEEEEDNDLADYGTSPVANALVVTQFDPTSNAVSTFLNGTQKFSHSPPKAQLNAGTAIHLGGGGDLSQPDAVLMREAFFTNAVMTSSTVTALKANALAFYPALSFP
ncbi:MAG TPA: arabinofuranosidase catalytic domain-containing protein [Polyangia bacterium]|nr:arabinofuranosidase catalytic domain-containing protein [Polyangia bacterium]